MSINEYINYDITDFTYDQFVDFLFSHEVIPRPAGLESSGPWYWNAIVKFNSEKTADFYIRLFLEPAFLLDKYSKSQLEQGFWAIQSGNLECSISEVIWDVKIPLETREKCVRAMFSLYQKLFSIEPLETAVEMWWDSLAYCWHCENRSRDKGGEDRSMQDVMFETLAQILSLSSPEVQASALHGLGHLHHPDTEAVIKAFIANNPQSELLAYARAAGQFDVL